MAPRRTAVAAAVHPADLCLPREAPHFSGVSYGDGLRPGGGEFKRLRRSRGTGRCHNGDQTAPFRAIHDRVFGLQNGCRTGTERRVWREKSLQMSGSAYGIRTRVTAVRGTPSEAQIGSRKGIGLASQHDCHRLVPSPTGDLGCSVFPRRRQGAPGFEPGPSSFSGRLSCRMEPAFLFSWH